MSNAATLATDITRHARRNVLEFRKDVPSRSTEQAATVVALHGASARHTQLLPLLRPAVPNNATLLAPRSARWCAFTDGLPLYTWYTMQQRPNVDPVSFGDALWQLESFLWWEALDDPDMRLPSARKLLLVGFEQGAGLALTLSAIWPEIVSGVIAIDAFWPRPSSWQPEVRDMNDMPVLAFVGDSHSTDDLEHQFRSRNAALTTVAMPDGGLNGSSLSPAIGKWIGETLNTESD